MFSNYLATQKDLKTVEDGLKFVLHPKMRFVFKDRSKIINTTIVLYDSKFIYIWKINPIKLISKVPHNLRIPDKWQMGWWAGIVSRQIKKYLPEEIRKTTQFKIPIISGGLLTPFITLQKTKNVPVNPYITQESYLATIVHEFGHVYWNSHKLWWHSNKKENTRLLETAKNYYTGSKELIKISVKFPNPEFEGEVFAFCTEYYASEIFWPSHKTNIDKSATSQIEKMVREEKPKDLNTQNSILEPNTNPHDYSIVIGKTLLTQFPTNWVTILTKPSVLI